VLNDAARQDIIDRNPCDRVNRPRSSRKPKFEVLTIPEIMKLIDVLAKASCFAGILLAAFGGLRRGEALAARWQDIDLDTGLLHVCRSLEQTTKNGLRFKSTKEDERALPGNSKWL